MSDLSTAAGRRDYALDWLTGLLPVALIALFGYRWQFTWLTVLAAGGYLMAAVLLERLLKAPRDPALIASSFVTGLLVAFCLPATTPFWPAALGGGLLAAAGRIPAAVGRVALPSVHPLVLTYVLLRLLVPREIGEGFTLAYQWRGMDTLSTATPLVALQSGELEHTPWQLFFGMRAGAMGEVCVAAITLGAGYLLMRRRLRLIAPACMLATVSLLSLLFWDAPLYGLLAGATALSGLLLADRAYMPHSYPDQIVAGITAGVVTVLIRRFGGWAEGAAVGLLTAYLAVFLRPYILRLIRLIPGADRLFSRLSDIFSKKQNNG